MKRRPAARPAKEDTSAKHFYVAVLTIMYVQKKHGEQCRHFRVRTGTEAWRIRVRLANELPLLDGDRVQLLIGGDVPVGVGDEVLSMPVIKLS